MAALAALVTAPPAGAATATTPLAVTVPVSSVLTLPAHDGFHDSVPVTASAGAAWAVDVVAVRGTRTVTVAKAVRLKSTEPGTYGATVRAHVAALSVGSWRIQVRRSSHPATRATAARTLRVGSGKATRVRVASSATTLFPYRDGYLDRTPVTVTARDETGTALPFTGRARVTVHGRTRSVAISSRTGTATVNLSVAGLPTGTAALTGSVRGPAGTTRTSAAKPLTLSRTGVTSVTVVTSSTQLEPIVDGRYDTVGITVTGTTTTGGPTAATGSLEAVGPSGAVVKRWALTGSAPKTITWDGRVAGAIVAGTVTLRASLQGPQGLAHSAGASLVVSKQHLPWRVRTLFMLPKHTGNQQGLAEHNGEVYVAKDLGTDGTRIDVFSRASGLLTRSIGPLQLGHGAEISVGSDGLLYVVNGGPATSTMVFVVDPAAGTLVRTLDLTRFGTGGLIAYDLATDHLLVYGGTAAGYAVTPVDLQGQAAGDPVPLPDRGVPQGLEVVQGQLWLYTSGDEGNRISIFDLTSGALLDTIAPVFPGEGEGLAIDSANGEVLLGAHGLSRVGVLERVPDE